jgi:hypothetical protein
MSLQQVVYHAHIKDFTYRTKLDECAKSGMACHNWTQHVFLCYGQEGPRVGDGLWKRICPARSHHLSERCMYLAGFQARVGAKEMEHKLAEAQLEEIADFVTPRPEEDIEENENCDRNYDIYEGEEMVFTSL